MEEVHLKLPKTIAANPTATQRELSQQLGVSLGKANYCLKALVEKGWVKAGHFRASPNRELPCRPGRTADLWQIP